MKRRKFVENSALTTIGISVLGLQACKKEKKKEEKMTEGGMEVEKEETVFFQISLAQWSINRMIREEGLDPYLFAEKAKQWGFTGLEYVSGLYYPELEKENFSEAAMKNFVDRSNAEAKKHGLQNLLIMIDGQGNLAVNDEAERKAAIENHYKWVDAAAAMGCHSIRVNLAGSTVEEEWLPAAIDGLKGLSTYAMDKNINVIVENHGGLSSNGALLAQVMQKVNMKNCGTLPDFGNFCIAKEDPNNWHSTCVEMYDRYKGVAELMPYAKAVSAKSMNFDANGNETDTDYNKMLRIVKDAGYAGFIGVEYEGDELNEEAGILATKNLLIKAAKTIV